MGEGIPVKRLTPKGYLKSFLDASESHKTSANLSVRAYFRQFSDWWETYFGHSQESPGRHIPQTEIENKSRQASTLCDSLRSLTSFLSTKTLQSTALCSFSVLSYTV